MCNFLLFHSIFPLLLSLQILDIVREKRLRRSILVALMHPLSQQQRKLVLNKARHDAGDLNTDPDTETETNTDIDMDMDAQPPDPMTELEAVSLLQIGFNSYRGALGHIISSERDRFSLLACLLIEKFINLDVTECHERSKPSSRDSSADTIEFARNALEPLSLVSMCAPVSATLSVEEEETEEETKEDVTKKKAVEETEEDRGEAEGGKEEEEKEGLCDSTVDETSELRDQIIGRQDSSASCVSIDGHEAWLASVKDSVPNMSLELEGVKETDLSLDQEKEEKEEKEEDEELEESHLSEQDEDGTYRGAERNGRRRGCSQDMNSGRSEARHKAGSGLENVIYDADGISVRGLGVLSESLQFIRTNYETLDSMRSNSNPNNCDLDSQSILGHMLALFASSSMHSLALLQTVAVVTYDMACLSHYAHKPMPGSDISLLRCPADILESKAVVLSALQSTAKRLLIRANGWLSDTLLSQLEEEIRRSLGGEKKWINVLHKISRNLLLVLPPTTHLSKRLGLSHATPTSAVESSRRELQIFLLLRSLYLCLSRLSSSPFALSSAQDLSDSLVDEFIHIFSEHGGSTAPYLTGTPLDWADRSDASLPACVVFPHLPPSVTSSSNSYKSSSAGAFTPPPKSSHTPPTSPLPSAHHLTDTLIANGVKMKNKLSPIPKLVGNTVFRSGDKPRRIGEVVFVRDESTLLLTVPDFEEDGSMLSRGNKAVMIMLCIFCAVVLLYDFFKSCSSCLLSVFLPTCLFLCPVSLAHTTQHNTTGTVLVAVPLHRTDVVSDDEDTRNVKLLVRSPVPIACMVCLSSPDGTSGEAARGHSKMASILPPRSPGVLYQMIIGFESKEVCDEVIQFIEARRSVYATIDTFF
jgi:hypothetical protein